jgi:hypothetical protein
MYRIAVGRSKSQCRLEKDGIDSPQADGAAHDWRREHRRRPASACSFTIARFRSIGPKVDAIFGSKELNLGQPGYGLR